jgi:hypothetical protein
MSKWLIWSRQLSSHRGGESLVAINGISCAHTRTDAVQCCGDLLEHGSFAADRGGAVVLPSSQFLDQTNRAHRGKAKIKAKLIGDHDPDEWDLPPKPKWMRWPTYDRYVERFDKYQAILDEGVEALWEKLVASNLFSDE